MFALAIFLFFGVLRESYTLTAAKRIIKHKVNRGSSTFSLALMCFKDFYSEDVCSRTTGYSSRND